MSMPLLGLDGSVSLVGRTRGLFQDVVVAFDSFQPCELLIGIHDTTDTPGKAEAEGFLNRAYVPRTTSPRGSAGRSGAVLGGEPDRHQNYP